MIKYEKTNNSKIFKRTQTTEFSIEKLEKDIENLKKQIENLPKPKTKPDQETLDMYNSNIDDGYSIKEELKEKQKLLKEITK